MTDGPLVLGIETSCDETGVGIVRGRTLLADAVASSVEQHARYGGVVPEVASRAHLEAMVPMIDKACRDAGIRLDDLDAIAVTAGPGLAGALLVGVAAAKSLAVALGKPLYGVNHLAAHVAVDIVEHGPLAEPTMAMLVSGGHSSLLLVPDVTNDVRSLGGTIDDAAGEAFDKVARVLGVPSDAGGGPGGLPGARGGRPADRWRRGGEHAVARHGPGALRYRRDPAPRSPAGAVHGQRCDGGRAGRCHGGQGPAALGPRPAGRLIHAGHPGPGMTTVAGAGAGGAGARIPGGIS